MLELIGADRRRVAVALALMLSVSATEWIGVILLIPLLGLAGVPVDEGAVARITEMTGGAFSVVGLQPTLVSVLSLYALLIAARALLKRWQVLAMIDYEQYLSMHLRTRLYRATLLARWHYLSNTRASELMNALTGQVHRAAQGARALLAMVAHVLVAAVYFLLALKLSFTMTLLAGACGAVLMFAVRNGANRSRAAGETMTARTNALYAAISEHLGGLKTAKSYGAEGRSIALFQRLSADVADINRETSRHYTSVRATLEIGSVLLLCASLYVALGALELATADILLLVFLFTRLVPRFANLQEAYQYVANAAPAFENIMSFIRKTELERDLPADDELPEIHLRHGIRFQDISFRYGSTGERPALSQLSLFIPARQTTAIIGQSGAGKSTIADLLMGLLTPDAGEILLDGKLLGPAMLRGWRHRIGYVPQDSFLFHDTIRTNLLWARPDATENELWEALRGAAAEDFVRKLPLQLETVVGDRGVLLSGGERQRVTLARALLRRPELLILDEATSALDSEHEQQIQQAIHALRGAVTIVVITHRLSSARHADRICVIDEGRLVEAGSWPELSERNGRFAELCRAQELPSGQSEPLRSGVARVHAGVAG